MPVLRAQRRHWRLARKRDVFHPLGHLLHRAASHVTADTGGAVKEFAQFKKLVSAEAVIIQHSAPDRVEMSPPLLANAVFPVVPISETAAWPAQVRNLNRLERLKYRLVKPIDVGNRRIFTHLPAAVDTATKMLGEMPVDMLADPRQVLICINVY